MSMHDCQHQESAKWRLQKMAASGRIGHGMVFHGPVGVGKHLLALRWAKYLLCENQIKGDHVDSCGQCGSCKLVEAENHPDLHLVNKQLFRYTKQWTSSASILSLSIHVIRKFVIEVVGQRSVYGRGKVFVIDGADEMLSNAQNALLKTLEEPPAGVSLILISSNKVKLLPTIRSRVQEVSFKGLPTSFIESHLLTLGIENGEAKYWSDFCDGSLGGAIDQAGKQLYSIKNTLIEKLAQLSRTSVIEFAKWIIDQVKAESKKYQKEDKGLTASAATRAAYKSIIAIFSHTLKVAIRMQAVLQKGGFELSGESNGIFLALSQTDQRVLIEQIALKFGVSGCAEAVYVTHRASSELDANTNPSLLFESLLLQYLDCMSSSRYNATAS